MVTNNFKYSINITNITILNVVNGWQSVFPEFKRIIVHNYGEQGVTWNFTYEGSPQIVNQLHFKYKEDLISFKLKYM